MSLLADSTKFWHGFQPPMPFMVAVVGPTASGKSVLAKQIAKEIDGYLISADSRQIYRGMEIGTNVDSVDLPHALGFGVGIIDPHESYSVAQFQSDAVNFMYLPENQGRVPVVVGGTGQWVQSLTEGWMFPKIPPRPALRAQLQQEYESYGIDPLVKRLRARLPWTDSSIDIRNPRRVIRGLERTEHGSVRVSGLVTTGIPVPIVYIGCDLPEDQLMARIELRVLDMLRCGWIEEVRALMARYPDLVKNLKQEEEVPDAFRSIGYRELIQHVDSPGNHTLNDAYQDIVRSTKRYVRRQRTWWRKQYAVRWSLSVQESLSFIRRSYIHR